MSIWVCQNGHVLGPAGVHGCCVCGAPTGRAEVGPKPEQRVSPAITVTASGEPAEINVTANREIRA